MNTISSLNHITAEYIKSITNNGIYSRGLSYYKNGHVRNLKYVDGKLTAEVTGDEPLPYNVFILSDGKEIYDMNCACFYASDGEICKHIVATLLQLIARRNNTKSHQSPHRRQKMLLGSDDVSIFDIIDRTMPFSCYENNPTDVLKDLFSYFGDFNLKVDLLNGWTRLELKLISEQGDESVFHISAERSPSVFVKLIESHRYNIELSVQARRTKLYKTTLVLYLHADINNHGCIELSPVLKLKGPNKNNQTFFANNLI
jgi:hypothetical protein